MLIYLAAGERDYDRNPIRPVARICWEIQAVTEGRIALQLPGKTEPPQQRKLWVFPPGHVHGWQGDQGRTAQVIVFHFEALPDPVGEWVRQRGHFEWALSTAQLQRLRALHAEAETDWRRPGVLTSIRWSRLALDLALLIGELINPVGEGAAGRPQSSAGRVEAAMRVFAEHLHEGWNVNEVSGSIGVSAPHLRRLFHEVLGSSPRNVFERIRLRRAQELMMQPEKTLEVVALQCGYQSGSTLSRAFRREFSMTPSQWLGRAVPKETAPLAALQQLVK